MKSLTGVKVIEFCEIAAGPYCGMLVADMGADVIKVERPGGDAMRTWPPLSDGYSENFASINRGKRSVTLNLKDPADIAVAQRLIASADVVIENFRPGVMKRNGLDYDTMSKLNEGLIFCSISAFGQTGPRAAEGGFDLTMQAMSGVMSVTGEPGGAPVKCGVPLCDFVAGLYGAFAISAAIAKRASTGKGQHIDVSMLGTTLAVSALQTSEFFGTGLAPQKLGSAHPRNAPYQAFKAKDGFFGMAAGNNSLWHSVCDVVARPDLKAEEKYANPTLRAKHQGELRILLEEIFETQPVEDWISAFAEAGVPCSPINTFPEALNDPQVQAMGWIQDLELPNGVKTRTFGPALRIDNEVQTATRRPPALGEHNQEVLAELAATGNA